MKECVLIVYGGKSVEHDISIITALQVSKNLPENYDFQLCYIDREGQWHIAENLADISIYQNFEKLAKKQKNVTIVAGQNVLCALKRHKLSPLFRIRAVLNCCHGHVGEDGSLQGLFECSGIAQSSPSVLPSALCMDKALFKDVCRANKIATSEFIVFREGENREKFENLASKKIKFPCIVKPANLGSSIGITLCQSVDEMRSAIDLALSFSQKIIVEKAVENLREFNCACLKYRGKLVTSHVAEVTNKSEIFTFEDKYLSKESTMQDGSVALGKKIKFLTQKIYHILDLSGVVRVDFLFDQEREELFVNEINTIPGSLAFYLFKDVAFSELISATLEEALRDKELENSKITTFESDALKIFEQASGGVKK